MDENHHKINFPISPEFQQLKQISVHYFPKEITEPIKDNQKSQNGSTHQINYRADIDGLRTVAVGMVIIFHAWPDILPGGFIGVDIFFVISGYLISSIIITQIKKNRFSYIDFYSRRIKRIYPALILVLIFVLVVGMMKLLRRPLEIMCKTLAASTVFGANIQILTAENDYFDPDTKTNPLLHLWSLGVEQQFYIFWPFLLTLIFTKFQNKALIILSSFTVLSFLLNIICVFIDSEISFFFPFCRFWQMSIGTLIAYLNVKINQKGIKNAISAISLILIIIITLWIIDENKKFPGFWALIPTIGAACIIQAGNTAYINEKFLSNKLFVFVGKISYSLYLWHWPLLVFSNILYPIGSKSVFSKPEIMVAIAFLLSILTYYLIENPLRVRKQRLVTLILFFIMFLICLSALYVKAHASEYEERYLQQLVEQRNSQYINDMIPLQEDFYIKKGRRIPNSSKNPKRQPTTILKLTLSSQQMIMVPMPQKRYQQVLLGKKITEKSQYYRADANQLLHHYEVANEGRENQLFIIGDSHGRFILNRFQKLYEDSQKNGRSQSFPTIVAIIRQTSTFVPWDKTYNISMSLIRQFKPKRIFFVYRWLHRWRLKDQYYWSPYEEMKYYEEIMSRFQNQLQELASTGVQIYLSGINPEGNQYNPSRMKDQSSIIQQNTKPISLTDFRSKFNKYIQILQSIAQNVGAKIVDFSDNMCYNDNCQVLTPTGYSVTFDQNHQTKLYSRNWAGTVDFLTQF